jgi:hypothetical protein
VAAFALSSCGSGGSTSSTDTQFEGPSRLGPTLTPRETIEAEERAKAEEERSHGQTSTESEEES